MNSSADIWQTRTISWSYLNAQHPLRVEVVISTYDLIDSCVDEFEATSQTSTYARICGLALLKGKNLSQGALSLILDGLGQEAGALLRPMIEYAELLTYLRKFPDKAEKAAENNLPKAGLRAKAVGGIFQGLREHLNEHASHSSFSHYSLSHLLTPEFSFRKNQQFASKVLDKNFRDFAIQLQLILQEGVLALEPLNSTKLYELAYAADNLKGKCLDAFNLNT